MLTLYPPKGRRIVHVQTAQALINAPQESQWPRNNKGIPLPDQYGRKPYLHPALAGLQGLTEEAQTTVLSKQRLSQIGERCGLDKVVRWTPKRADDLVGSGQETILSTALYAIVGAIALERGGEMANKVVQGKILGPLGFSFAVES